MVLVPMGHEYIYIYTLGELWRLPCGHAPFHRWFPGWPEEGASETRSFRALGLQLSALLLIADHLIGARKS